MTEAVGKCAGIGGRRMRSLAHVIEAGVFPTHPLNRWMCDVGGEGVGTINTISTGLVI